MTNIDIKYYKSLSKDERKQYRDKVYKAETKEAIIKKIEELNNKLNLLDE